MFDFPETRASLIARVKDPADAAAWGELIAIYRPVVYRLARSRGLQDADADDLSQQVFISIASAIKRFEPGEHAPPFRAWLYRIARNAILKALTRQKPDVAAGSTSAQELLHEIPDADPGLSAQLLRETRMEAFRWAAKEVRREFTETTWIMFWETAVAGHPAADVAESVGRSAGAVYVARCRVMQRIKEKVGELTGPWDEIL